MILEGPGGIDIGPQADLDVLVVSSGHEALRASVEWARSHHDTREKATTSRRQKEKSEPAKKRVPSNAESLQSLTKADLYKRARPRTSGRSTMTHDQLVKALTSAARGGNGPDRTHL